MKIMKLFRTMSLPIAAMLSLTMLLSSCGQTAESLGSIGSGSLGGLHYDSKERQILGQARGVGMLVGATAGALIAKNNGINPIVGGLVGGLIGAAGGDAVGKHQANNARNKRLSNDNMRQMIASVRANNARLVAYNRKVSRRIAEIRAAKASDRAKMAKAEYRYVNKAVQATNKRIANLEKTRSSLSSSSQRRSLNVELRKTKGERDKLVSHSHELSKLASR